MLSWVKGHQRTDSSGIWPSCCHKTGCSRQQMCIVEQMLNAVIKTWKIHIRRFSLTSQMTRDKSSHIRGLILSGFAKELKYHLVDIFQPIFLCKKVIHFFFTFKLKLVNSSKKLEFIKTNENGSKKQLITYLDLLQIMILDGSSVRHDKPAACIARKEELSCTT